MQYIQFQPQIGSNIPNAPTGSFNFYLDSSDNSLKIKDLSGSTFVPSLYVTGGTYNTANGSITFENSDNTNFSITGISAVTGGTYNSSTGVIVLSGTNNINGSAISGFPIPFTWQNAVSPLTASTNNGYITTGITTITLPTLAQLGSTMEFVAGSLDVFTINQNDGQYIVYSGSQSTIGSGTLVSQSVGDSIKLLCTSANTVFTVVSAIGNFTLT